MRSVSQGQLEDRSKLGSIPLESNDPADRYVYEVIFQTGYQKGSATDSNISFVLAGESSETEVRRRKRRRSRVTSGGGRGS